MLRFQAAVVTLLALPILMAGCATPSGKALEGWVSGSLGRLRDALDPDRLVVPELRRGKQLLAKAPVYPRQEIHRSRALLGASLEEVGRVSSRTQKLPETVMATVEGEVTHTRRRVANALGPEGLLRRTLDPKTQMAAVRRIYRRLPAVLGLDRQPLPGPGDPDRQTVAHPTGPTQTWVEKILHRVRL
jgi:hypothetical protein